MESVLSPPAPRLAAPPLAAPLVSDERLAKLVGRGDESAFRVMYKRYHRPLYRYCRSLLRNDADAEDALQCAFVSALQALRREQRDVPVRPWLFRIAHNESISLIRRRRSDQQLTDGCEAHTIPLEEQVEERERLALLVADLRALSERQRAALVMRELSGLSHKEIALALGVSVDAAKQSIFEARGSLTEFTAGRAMDCEEVRRMISDADGRILRSRRVRAHTRHCTECAAFAAAIPDRSRQLQALAPGLPPAAAAGLARWIAGSMGQGDTAGLAAGAGKTLGAGVSLVMKATAITATTAVVVAGTSIELPHILPHQPGHRGATPVLRSTRGVRGSPASGRHGLGTGRVAAGRGAATRPERPGRTRGGHDGDGQSKTSAASISAEPTGRPSSAPRSQAAKAGDGQGGSSDAQHAGGGQGSGGGGGQGSDTGGGQGSNGDAQGSGSGGGQGSGSGGQGGSGDAQGSSGSAGAQGSSGSGDAQGTSAQGAGAGAQSGSSSGDAQGSTDAAAAGPSTNRPSSSAQPAGSTTAANEQSSPPPATAGAAGQGDAQSGASSTCGGSGPGCGGSGDSGN